ncbi:MAG TPA: hypothetical protein VK002_08315 [Rubricoccaceae bacterium]|nr:hypothetical protein [Rubricoccaceae bacterium]
MSNIPPAGRAARFLLPFGLLALLLVPLAACGDGGDDPEVEVPDEPSAIDNPDLLGYWVVTEMNGATPPAEIRYQFTAQGDFIRYQGTEVERSRYTFAAPGQITVDGPAGAAFYDYQLDGDELTLSVPGEGGETMRLRKLADQDLEDVPPPTSVPEEDSLPADSMMTPAQEDSSRV